MKRKLKQSWRIIFLILFFLFDFYIYYQRVGSFSFGDEWNNFMAAYMMKMGRQLHSEIFFNHQPLAAHLSLLIQYLTKPESLYQLILYHRMFVVIFSFAASILLLYRFGIRVLGFIILFELTKYYSFGHLFLAESLIVYPIVYLFNLSWEKLKSSKLRSLDLVFAALTSWFAVFMREPFIPVGLILSAIVISNIRKRLYFLSMFIFFAFSIITLLLLPIRDYFDQVFIFNTQHVLSREVGSLNMGLIKILKGFFYPLVILSEGQWNNFRVNEILLSICFVTSFYYLAVVRKKIKLVLLIFITLGLANLRFVAPGKIFFESFHIVVWYGLFIMSIFLMFSEIIKFKVNKIAVILSLLLLVSIIYSLNPKSFIWEKVNRNDEFNINYAHYFAIGETIRLLSDNKDTLFADQWDYLIHYTSGLDSSYKYAFYTFTMDSAEKYQKEREVMFKKNPPDFYYTYCPKGVYKSPYSAIEISNLYSQLYRSGKPSCLYVKKTKLTQISNESWQKVSRFGFRKK